MKILKYLTIIVLIIQGQSIMAMKALKAKQNQIKPPLPPYPHPYPSEASTEETQETEETEEFVMQPPRPRPLPPYPSTEIIAVQGFEMPSPPNLEELGKTVKPTPPQLPSPSKKPKPTPPPVPSRSAKPITPQPSSTKQGPSATSTTPPPPPPPPPVNLLKTEKPTASPQPTKPEGAPKFAEELKTIGQTQLKKTSRENIEERLEKERAEKIKDVGAEATAVALKEKLKNVKAQPTESTDPIAKYRERFDAAKTSKNTKEIQKIQNDIKDEVQNEMDFEVPDGIYTKFSKEIEDYLKTIK